MNPGSIFLVDSEGGLSRMQPSAPEREEVIQTLIARYPELIVDDDGALLLIKREHPISDAEDGGARWRLDHLFVTRGAIPVLVEVKRAVDTRLRREVVGQMLDYAANGTEYWKPGRVAENFEASCAELGQDSEAVLADFLGDEPAQDFWEQVDTNFRDGRIKLVFVADVIPSELARIVEFLNEQMRADVRAIELRWYAGENGVTTLAPRIIGQTRRAVDRKTSASTPPAISRTDWIERKIAGFGDEAVAGANAFVQIMEALGGAALVSMAQGSIYARFAGTDGAQVYAFALTHRGGVQLTLRFLKARPGLVSIDSRRLLVQELEALAGSSSSSNPDGSPAFAVRLLADPTFQQQFETLARRVLALAL